MTGLPGCQHARDHQGEPAQRVRPCLHVQPLPGGRVGMPGRYLPRQISAPAACCFSLSSSSDSPRRSRRASVTRRRCRRSSSRPMPEVIGRCRIGVAVRGAEIRPCRRNVGAAAVRQFHQQLWHAAALEPAQYCQEPPFKGMALARNRHRGRKVLVTGSLRMFPSTESAKSGSFASWSTASATSASSA